MADILDFFGSAGVTPPTIRIIDVGAMHGSSADPWSRLVNRGAATLLGFEPQEEHCARRNAEAGPGWRFLPVALGDGEIHPFHRCRSSETSSFYKPNSAVIDQFNGLSELMHIVGTSPMPTRRLDDIEEAHSTDFLKLDVQGAELDILAHGTRTLKDVSIVQTEVSFLPLYEDQPLFADIDRFLRGEGFTFHTFTGFGSRMLKPCSDRNNPYAGIKQILWTDAVYVRLFDHTSTSPDPDTLLKRAILYHEFYQSYDLASRALQHHDHLTGMHLLDTYSAIMAGQQTV